MRILVLFSISVLLLFGCNSKDVENDLSKMKLSGPVKSLSKRDYCALNKFGELSKGAPSKYSWFYNEDILFNKSGNKTHNRSFDNNLQFTSLFTYGYNENGDISERKYYNKSLTYNSKDVYEYDNNGFLVTELNYELNDGEWELDSKKKYQPNSEGINLEKKSYDSNGDLSTVYKYDKNGYKIEMTSFEDNKVEFKHKYTNDKEGNVLEHIKYDNKGDITRKYNYKYELNNKVEFISYDKDGEVKRKRTFEYDDFNNAIKQVEFNKGSENEKTTTYTYEYDAYYNWIRRVTIENEIPTSITEREILYYDKENDNYDEMVEEYAQRDSSNLYLAEVNSKDPFSFSNTDLNLINTALQFYPKNIRAINHKARYYEGKNNFKKAVGLYKGILEFHENSSNTYMYLGYCESRLENYSSSIDYFNKAQTLIPDDDLPGWAYNHRAVSKYRSDLPYCDDFKKSCDLEFETGCENFEAVCK